MNRNKNLAIDVVALVAYLVAANPMVTGIPIHEWLGLGVFVVFFVHCAVHVDWMAEVLRSLKKSSLGTRGHLALDVLILVAFMLVTVSGLGVSGTVLPTFGLYADGYYFWNPLHAIAAKMLLALLLVHVVAHCKWLYGFFAKRKEGKDGKDA